MKSRKGSALLIVLGLLSFMIISAVAFAAYMRFSRMPSSFLRRTSASREMVKAALARAIDHLDAAIGNNPHPGVGSMYTAYPRNTEDGVEKRLRNLWVHRVLFGQNAYTSASNTVPVLTLEALAYLPPSLVNDVRHFSRLTPTAAWNMLDFDVGRYAYCVVDVSDYLDINKLFANYGRTSEANGRISLSYLFDGTTGGTAQSWETWMEKFREAEEEDGAITLDWSASKPPLVSLADYNLAMKGYSGPLESPFYDFVNSGRAQFYGSSSPAQKFARQTFVTDSYFPPNSGEFKDFDEDMKKLRVCNLTDESEQGQPFAKAFLKQDKPRPSQVAIKDNGGLQSGAAGDGIDPKWSDAAPGFTYAALYDYLDPDHYPISLAIPTTERVPMVCAIKPEIGDAKFRITKTASGDDKDTVVGSTETVTILSGTPLTDENIVVSKTILYKLQFALPSASMQAMTVFPFSHKMDDDESNFSADGRLAFFFSNEADMTLRTSGSDVLHFTDDQVPEGVANGVINIPMTLAGNLSPVAAPTTEEDAISDVALTGDTSAINDLNNNTVLLSVTYQWTKTLQSASTGGTFGNTYAPDLAGALAANAYEITAAHSGLPALTKTGVLDNDIANDARLVTFLKGGSSKTLYLNMAAWMRVKDNSRIVDMVPACPSDDKTQNSVNDAQMISSAAMMACGAAYPLMRFNTGGLPSQANNISFEFSIAGLEKAAADGTDYEVKLWPEAAMVPDPRFNYAPEHWKEFNNWSANNWLQKNYSRESGHDGDIFMATSDAGYLQSKYEFAMLPQLVNQGFGSLGASENHGDMQIPRNYSSICTEGADPMNVQMMWRTYTPWDDGDDNFNAFEIWPVVNGKGGFKVNPYTDSPEVMKAAFANTPIDWRRAGTDFLQIAKDKTFMGKPAATFNSTYAWNEKNSNAKFSDVDIENIAKKMIEAVRDRARDNTSGGSPNAKYLPNTISTDKNTREKCWNQWDGWQDYPRKSFWLESFKNLGWNYDEDNFCGVPLTDTDNLWSVDRKFLYGFWRECFDVKQQLFLVFVRAEPVMMGGGGVGQIPPQLGARAVALVWRNPDPVYFNGARQDDYPHQTRILFYRQLD